MVHSKPIKQKITNCLLKSLFNKLILLKSMTCLKALLWFEGTFLKRCLMFPFVFIR